jgi:hypothetical protein
MTLVGWVVDFGDFEKEKILECWEHEFSAHLRQLRTLEIRVTICAYNQYK